MEKNRKKMENSVKKLDKLYMNKFIILIITLLFGLIFINFYMLSTNNIIKNTEIKSIIVFNIIRY